MNTQKLSANNKKFGIVISRFNQTICKKLFDGAVKCLKENGCNESDITIKWVPGAFEIPLVAKKMAATKNYDAIICIGAVIRGETPHFDYISAAASQGIMNVGLESELPIIFGVLTTDTLAQAEERAGGKHGNKGYDAALTAIEMASKSKF